jgi:hypothetical protein
MRSDSCLGTPRATFQSLDFGFYFVPPGGDQYGAGIVRCRFDVQLRTDALIACRELSIELSVCPRNILSLTVSKVEDGTLSIAW